MSDTTHERYDQKHAMSDSIVALHDITRALELVSNVRNAAFRNDWNGINTQLWGVIGQLRVVLSDLSYVNTDMERKAGFPTDFDEVSAEQAAEMEARLARIYAPPAESAGDEHVNL